jgi:hypothetical protein
MDNVTLIRVLAWLLLASLFGGLSAFIAKQRGASPGKWFILGMVFGIFGFACSFMSSSGRRCPHCRSAVRSDATVCPACHADLPLEAAVSSSVQWRCSCGYEAGEYDAVCSRCGAARPATPQAFRCPKCHHPVELNTPQCPGCGGLFKAGLTKKCPDCAEEVKADARKCRFCGCVFSGTVT